LEVRQGGSVVEFDEGERFLIAHCADPAGDGGLFADEGFKSFGVQNVFDLGSHITLL
jgi:hypothetical protein